MENDIVEYCVFAGGIRAVVVLKFYWMVGECCYKKCLILCDIRNAYVCSIVKKMNRSILQSVYK